MPCRHPRTRRNRWDLFYIDNPRDESATRWLVKYAVIWIERERFMQAVSVCAFGNSFTCFDVRIFPLTGLFFFLQFERILRWSQVAAFHFLPMHSIFFKLNRYCIIYLFQKYTGWRTLFSTIVPVKLKIFQLTVLFEIIFKLSFQNYDYANATLWRIFFCIDRASITVRAFTKSFKEDVNWRLERRILHDWLYKQSLRGSIKMLSRLYNARCSSKLGNYWVLNLAMFS